MWLIGHTALAYVVIKVIWIVFKSKSNSKSNNKGNDTELRDDTKKYLLRFSPHFIILLFVFANWPDFIHVGELRILSHNLLAVFVVPIIILLVLHRFNIVNRLEATLLVIASGLHALTDTLFSAFHLLYPFQSTAFSIYPFNSPQDIIAEGVIITIFLTMFLWTRDWKVLSNFLSNCFVGSWRKVKSDSRNVLIGHLYIFIFLLFSLFALIQLVMNMDVFFAPGYIIEWYRMFFIIIFTVFIGILGIIFLTSVLSAQRMYSKELKK